MTRHPWRYSGTDIPDLMSRFSRLNLSARLCNLDLNPDAARPLALLVSILSTIYVHTFQTQTLGLTLHFGSKSGCGAILGATHDQPFQTFCSDFPDSNSRRDSAIWSKSGRSAKFGATLVQTFQTFCPDFPDSNSRRDSGNLV